jgi:hypothetical protein
MSLALLTSQQQQQRQRLILIKGAQKGPARLAILISELQIRG